jgi:hypothetical protein
VDYYANKKAWMTSSIFGEVLAKLDAKMEKSGRNILLFVDNAACHPEINLKNIKLVFLPPNTTSKLQPCDAGIIQMMKTMYRKLLLKDLLFEMERCSSVSQLAGNIDVLQSIYYIDKSIKLLQPEALKKCFERCGFCSEPAETVVSTNETGLSEIQNLISTVYGNDSYGARDYVAIDSDLATDTISTDLEDVIGDIIGSTNEQSNDEYENELESTENNECLDDNSTPMPSKTELCASLEVLQNFARHSGDPTILESVLDLKLKCMDQIFQDKHLTQTSILSYFGKK